MCLLLPTQRSLCSCFSLARRLMAQSINILLVEDRKFSVLLVIIVILIIVMT